MKFLNEVLDHPLLTEEKIDEATGAKQLYITGVFMEADTKNRNNRIYPSNVMKKAVNEYIEKQVKTNSALCEINHPERLHVDPAQASHRVTELWFDGKNVMGKALVLATPAGNTLKGLLEGKCRLGISSRGTGTIMENNGVKTVGDDFTISAIDAVLSPSALNAYISPLMESKEFAVVNGQIVEVNEATEKAILEKHGVKPATETKKLSEAEMLSAIEKVMAAVNPTLVKEESMDPEGDLKNMKTLFKHHVKSQVFHHAQISKYQNKLATQNPHADQEGHQDHRNWYNALDMHVKGAQYHHEQAHALKLTMEKKGVSKEEMLK